MTEGQTGVDTSIRTRIAVVAGLLAIVVTQPVLDLFGRNPAFFTAGPYGPRQVVAFGVVVAAVPSALAALVLVGAAGLHPRIGHAAYLTCLVVLGAAFGNVLLRGVGVDAAWAAAVATIAGAVLVVRIDATTPGRMLLKYLALANAVFLASFLLLSQTSGLLRGESDDLGSVSVPTPPGPVVVVVLDELPVTTLMRADGSINGERFPGFAELADRSTWFRNASVHHTSTPLAVPALLTGTLTRDDQLPSHQDHPRNLVTLLAEQVPVSAYEPVTTLCPESICAPQARPPLSQAVADASVAYAHRLLPSALRDGLPDIGTSWGRFVDGTAKRSPADLAEGTDPDDPFSKLGRVGADERSRPGQAAVLAERTAAIGAAPALHVIHVLLPHSPWVLAPDGNQLLNVAPKLPDPDDPGYAWAARERFQLHSMQLGVADLAISRLIDRLDELDVWDDTTLVIVADHGVGTSGLELRPPEVGREVTPESIDEVLRVPLFIHSPRLAEGAIVDEPAQSIDLLPTLVDLLGIQTDWELDGHSLVDGSDPRVPPRVGSGVDGALAVARRHAAEFPYGDSWTALAAVGAQGDLVGTPLAELDLGAPSSLRWGLDHARKIRQLPTDDGRVPRLLTGFVTGGSGEPPELLVAVNGTVAGVAGGYVRDGEHWRFRAFLGPFLVAGANDYEAYEVDVADGRRRLHRVCSTDGTCA